MKKTKWHIIRGKKVMKGLKKIVLVASCGLLMGSVVGCNFSTREDYLAKSNRSDEAEADKTMQSIIDALEAKDAESLKALFSKYAVENAEDLDEKIEELMDFYPGSSDGFKGSYNTEESTNYGVKTKVLNGIYTVSNDGKTYRVGFTIQLSNDEEPEKIGLYLIEVMTPEVKPEGFKWKGVKNAPGIYVLE